MTERNLLTERPTDWLLGGEHAAGQKSSSARPNFTPTPKSVSVTIYEYKVEASFLERCLRITVLIAGNL